MIPAGDLKRKSSPEGLAFEALTGAGLKAIAEALAETATGAETQTEGTEVGTFRSEASLSTTELAREGTTEVETEGWTEVRDWADGLPL